MHINVRDILIESVGYNRAYKISGERPHLENIRLTEDINGEVTISRLDDGLLAEGQISTAIELECHRCLRTFSQPTKVSFSQIFTENPGDDEMPIIDEAIDLAPLLDQEITLALPIKILCRPDCDGVEASEQYTKEDSGNRLGSQARITKGTKRGRT